MLTSVDVVGSERSVSMLNDKLDLPPVFREKKEKKKIIPRRGVELSVIVPTFNERDNVVELIKRMTETLSKYRWEVVFVDDDSPDDTAKVAREIAGTDNRVRCIQRIGRRGLSSACIEGMLSSSAPYLAVIDGDLQHDEALLPQMLETLKSGGAEIVIGTRYAAGGGFGDWSQLRIFISRLATKLSRFVLKANLSDPMSGFFMLRRELLECSVRKLSGVGFKILVDIFASSPHPPKFVEIPYKFRLRRKGESKLDSHVAWEYAILLLDKFVGRAVPVRFVAFGFVGGIGLITHFIVLTVFFRELQFGFELSQTIATFVAMTSNFALNNTLTYRDKKLKGWRWVRGWASFTAACSVGALANVGIASYLFNIDTKWMFAALAGILVSTVWNYAVTTFYTWEN